MIDIKFSGTVEEVCTDICEWANNFRMATTFARQMAGNTSSVPAPPQTNAQPTDEKPPFSPPRKRGRPAAKADVVKTDPELPAELTVDWGRMETNLCEIQEHEKAARPQAAAERMLKVTHHELKELTSGAQDPTPQEVTFDDIRAAAMQIMERRGSSESDKAAGTEDVRTWLASAGVTRLRELQEKDYAPLMAYAQEKGWLK